MYAPQPPSVSTVVQRPLRDRLRTSADLKTRVRQLLLARGTPAPRSIPDVLRQRSRRLLRGAP